MPAPARRARLALVTTAAAIVLAGCGAARPAPADEATPPGLRSRTAETPEGRLRSYLLYVPPATTAPMPLVLVFHGAESTAGEAVRETDFVQAAERDGLLVAFLQGYRGTWNEGAGHTPARVAGVNDVAFAATVVEQLEHLYPVDRTRVAATGFSNGALLSELLGCRLAGELTAIAPLAGPLPVSVSPFCKPSRPISVFEMHGTADEAIPYTGGHFPGVGGGTTVLSAPSSAARWASLNGCKRPPILSSPTPGTVLSTYSGCREGVTVQLRTLEGVGHGWPHEAGALLAAFLQSHPRPVHDGCQDCRWRAR